MKDDYKDYIPGVALFTILFLFIVLVAEANNKPPPKTAEQIQQERLKVEYERGQRFQSFLRGVVGSKPLHDQPEKQP
jgi:hypothetical protein